MIYQEILEEIDDNTISIKQDERGSVAFFKGFAIKTFHTASVKPEAVRGNHAHDYDEVLCILGGKGLCEIEVEDTQTGTTERIRIDESIKTFKIKAGIKHSIRNVGENEFYLISFLTDREVDLP